MKQIGKTVEDFNNLFFSKSLPLHQPSLNCYAAFREGFLLISRNFAMLFILTRQGFSCTLILVPVCGCASMPTFTPQDFVSKWKRVTWPPIICYALRDAA